jgi:hypothetical protein
LPHLFFNYLPGVCFSGKECFGSMLVGVLFGMEHAEISPNRAANYKQRFSNEQSFRTQTGR